MSRAGLRYRSEAEAAARPESSGAIATDDTRQLVRAGQASGIARLAHLVG
jgi:hypothetical protein